MAPRKLVLAVLIACLPAVASARMSDLRCDDSSRLTHMLTHELGAERKGVGLRDPETLLEIWIERKSGDWMIVQNYTNGTSCIVAIGESWEELGQTPA